MRYNLQNLTLQTSKLVTFFGFVGLSMGCTMSPEDYALMRKPDSQRTCVEQSLSLLRHNLRFDNANGSNQSVPRIGNEMMLFEKDMHCQPMPFLNDHANYPNPELK